MSVSYQLERMLTLFDQPFLCIVLTAYCFCNVRGILAVLQADAGYPTAIIITETFCFYIDRSIHIPIQDHPALFALPDAVGKFQLIVEMTAVVAGL